MAASLHSMQLANWQRGGGKGPRPKMISRPSDKANTAPATLDEARARKRATSDELSRRREQKEVNGAD